MPKNIIEDTLGGETGALYSSIDWSKSSIGHPENWPEILVSHINTMLSCPIPMYICWGPDRAFLYNDAYRALLVKKHPEALGKNFEIVWPEVWEQLNPLFNTVKAGKNCYFEDMPLLLERHGYSEEGFFTFSFNPLFDAKAEVIGLQCICYETTSKIRGDIENRKLQREAELAQAEAELAAKELENFFLQVPVPIALLEGPEHIFRLVNMLYVKLVGGRRLIGLPVREAFPDLIDQPFFGFLDEVYRTGETFIAKEAAVQLVHENGDIEHAHMDIIYAARYSIKGEVEGINVTASNVTDQVQARQLVEKSEQELNQLANSMPQIFWVANAAGKVEYLNNRWTEYTGLSKQYGEDLGWFSVLHTDDVDRVRKLWEKSLATSTAFVTEARFRQEIGDYNWFRIHSVPLLNADGFASKWYGSCSDIHDLRVLTDELKVARNDLDSEKKKFEIIFEHAASAVALVREPKHIFEKVNASFVKLFGSRKLIGQPIETAFPELSGKNFVVMLDRTYNSGSEYKSTEERIEFKNSATDQKQVRYLDISFIQLKHHDGKVEGVLIDLVDATDRVLSRKRLEENEEWLMLATKAAKIGIWDLNLSRRTVKFSERSSEIFDMSGVRSLSLDDAFSKIPIDDVSGLHEALEAAFEPGSDGVYDVIHRVIMRNGGIRWVSVFGQARGNALGNDGDKRLTGAMIDITADVMTRNEVVSAREAADNANSAKSAFLANMSHEIRSPLGAIMGFVELLKESQLPREEILEYLGVIERNSHQLLRIIDDILDLSKVEAGKMLIENIDFSLLEVLSDFASLMGFKARDNGIDFVVKADTPLPDPIVSDPTRLRQILTNVVGNAIKFTKRGQVELTVSYADPFLVFNVRDTGVGISEDEATRLFQAFGQADISTTRKFGGTGLGLVLTKRLAQALGGDFWLERSEAGKGSLFIAKIRIETLKSSQLVHGSRFRFTTLPVSVSSVEAGLLDGAKILVVEDSPDNQMLLRVLLKRFGATVEIADDGEVGVKKALAEEFDLILMDVQMPRMDGYEAVRKLRAAGFVKPIVALTAHAMVEEREKCLKAGYSDFLSKPIDRTKLIEVIKIQLNRD